MAPGPFKVMDIYRQDNTDGTETRILRESLTRCRQGLTNSTNRQARNTYQSLIDRYEKKIAGLISSAPTLAATAMKTIVSRPQK